ncbi:hypothetical protein [Nostoc sp.]
MSLVLKVKPFSNLVSSLWLETLLIAALPLFLEAAAPHYALPVSD